MWRLPFFSLCLLLLVQQTRPGRAQSIETRPAKADAAVLVCRDKISSALGPTHLISPEGIHVDVPEKDVEAALARGFKWDMETLLKDVRSYGKGDQQSPEQTILAKLSAEELDTLQSDIFLCMSKQRDVVRDFPLELFHRSEMPPAK